MRGDPDPGDGDTGPGLRLGPALAGLALLRADELGLRLGLGLALGLALGVGLGLEPGLGLVLALGLGLELGLGNDKQTRPPRTQGRTDTSMR